MPTNTTTYQSTHSQTQTRDREGKLKRLIHWKHWRRYGLKGRLLEKKTRMDLSQVRKWAKELDFDLEGLA
jgi:hypothetical protein